MVPLDFLGVSLGLWRPLVGERGIPSSWMEEDEEEDEVVVVDSELGSCNGGSVMEGMHVDGCEAIVLDVAVAMFLGTL